MPILSPASSDQIYAAFTTKTLRRKESLRRFLDCSLAQESFAILRVFASLWWLLISATFQIFQETFLNLVFVGAFRLDAQQVLLSEGHVNRGDPVCGKALGRIMDPERTAHIEYCSGPK